MFGRLSGVTLDITDDEVMIYIKLFSLLYADDTALMAESPSGLHNCLDAFSCYCDQWKLNVNVAKLKLLYLERVKSLAFSLILEIK